MLQRQRKPSDIHAQRLYSLHYGHKRGSSCSPVFNDQWQVVAVHHSGVPDPDNVVIGLLMKVPELVHRSFCKKRVSKSDKKIRVRLRRGVYELKDLTYQKEDKEEDKPDPVKMRKRKKSINPGRSIQTLRHDPLFPGEDYRIDLPKLSQAMEEDSTKMKMAATF